MTSKQDSAITFVAVGDVSPNRDDPPSIFRHCGDVFRKADIVFGQIEAPLSDRGYPMFVLDYSPMRLAAKNISALTATGAGFDVMSFASNHAMDYGWEAFYDTLDTLHNNNIAVIGAGRNIDEARTPAIIERNGTTVGFLGYISIVTNAGLPALKAAPGCAPLRSSHFYKQPSRSPGVPPIIITNLYPEDRKAMEDDIKKLRPQVDVVVVSMHAGVLNVPAMIAMYQKEAAYAAIDCGADLVLQHHAHILKGIEVFKGKTVFYGLGNFALEHNQEFPGRVPWRDDDLRAEYRRFLHMEVQPGANKHKFAPEARNTMMAKAYIKDGKIQKVAYLPAYVSDELEPEVLTRNDPRAQGVFDYVKQISEHEALTANFAWEGDEVVIS